MKPLKLNRSAIAPVGMVAVASMNTSWKKKNAEDADVVRVAGEEEARVRDQLPVADVGAAARAA